jgi:hypothetical protein
MQNIPDVRKVYNQLKSSAKKRDIEFSLSIMDLYHLDYPISCPILGIPLKFHRGQALDDSPSVDRIDSSRGYVADNVQIISFKANRAKNNLTEDELKKFSLYYQL